MVPLATLAGFVLLAYGLSWVLWLPLVLEPAPDGGARALVWHWAGSMGPCLAALFVSAIRGRAALREWAQGLIRWRVSLPLLAAVLLGPLLALGVAQLAAGLLGGPAPDVVGMVRWPEWPFATLWLFPPGLLLFVGVGEEAGWRGFLLPALLPRLGFRGAVTVVAVIWAVWHLPLFCFRPTLAAMDAAGIAGWAFSILVGSVLTGWIWVRSHGSLWPVIILHTTLDLAFTAAAATPVSNMVIGMGLTLLAVLCLRRIPSASKSLPGGRHG